MIDTIRTTEQYDVAIIGGGLAGLTLTKQLLMRRPDTRVLIIEKQSFPVSEIAHKVGESTVEIGAHYLGEVIGLKKHLVDQQLPKFGLRFFFLNQHQSLADSVEVGGSAFFPAPGYQVDRGRLENHLSEIVADMGARLLTQARVSEIDIGNASEDRPHRVTVKRKGQDIEASCRWLVDASGRASFLKRQLEIADDISHNINAVWFRIHEEIRIDSWCTDPDWMTRTGRVPRRWLSTNHLLGEGYWVWIIPLASGATSIGIVADPRFHPLDQLNQFEKAMAWLEQHEPLCAAAIEPHRNKVKDFCAIKRMARGCRQVFSSDRWALTGEAAVFLDPLYSPGIDYIAMGNTMICRLIEDDLAGKLIDRLALSLQSVFLTLFQNNLMTYEDQYPLFGNARVMSLKYAWDYALYWSFPALLYFHGKLTDPSFIQSLSRSIEEMRDMNLRMQEFFRSWHSIDSSNDVEAVFIDQNQIEILLQLNAELRENLDNAAFKARFERNVQIIRDLMIEITARVCRVQPQLQPLGNGKSVSSSRLSNVFEALQL